MKYLFLDTNIFLHFQNFEQIPRGNLVGDVDFKIIVSDIVAGEIDKHKDGARGKIQKKAKVLSKLSIYRSKTPRINATDVSISFWR